ncbi:MAG TPA: hypothetical protein VFT22_42610 [Kofleriaceae bacterium]|nr:hypothetical protein [Kofleriaceae bacterium]
MRATCIIPCAIRLPDHAADLHPPGLEVDHEQHEVANEPRQREHLDREEVRGGDRAQVRADERLPRHPLAPRGCGLKAMSLQDPLDRVATDLVAEVVQRTDQPRVPPARILRRHPDHELFHVDGDCGTPGPAARRAVVLAGDQLAVPAQDRVGRDQDGELTEPATPDGPALDGQASPLVIGEPQAPPAELLAEDAVLLAQEVDDWLTSSTYSHERQLHLPIGLRG